MRRGLRTWHSKVASAKCRGRGRALPPPPTMSRVTRVLVVLAGYVLGTLPFAHLIAGRRGVDPTAEGSGNPGASNVYRTAGRGAGVAVLVCDALKGAAAVGLGLAVADRELGLLA